MHDSKNCLPVVSYETCLISPALKCEMPSIKEPGQRPVPKDFSGGWSHRQALLTKVLDLQKGSRHSAETTLCDLFIVSHLNNLGNDMNVPKM